VRDIISAGRTPNTDETEVIPADRRITQGREGGKVLKDISTRLEVSPEQASAVRLLVSVATAPCLSRNRWLSSFKETADATRYIAPLILI